MNVSIAPRRALIAVLCTIPALAQAPDAVDAAGPDVQPTAHETEVLCWINRFRSDPATFARLVLDGNIPENAAHVDWEMFTAELAALAPAPPVFFEPRLIQASRAHARYMVEAREYGHHETEGRPGFTGEWPQDRAHAAGYPHTVAECSWARGASPLTIVAGHVVDAAPPGGGTGGMQERRGHRRCMIDPKWREVGVGLFGWGDGQLSNVQLYGYDKGLGRVLGGVAIDDRDGDMFYDVGEGLGAVHVRIGVRGALTCNSGAFRLDLPRGEGGELVARLGSLELARRIEAGAENVQIDLCFEVAEAVAGLELELVRPESDAQRRAAKRVFAGTVVEAWLDDAGTADALVRAAALARAIESSKRRATRVAEAAADIEQALAEVRSPDLWHRLAALRHELLGGE